MYSIYDDLSRFDTIFMSYHVVDLQDNVSVLGWGRYLPCRLGNFGAGQCQPNYSRELHGLYGKSC